MPQSPPTRERARDAPRPTIREESTRRWLEPGERACAPRGTPHAQQGRAEPTRTPRERRRVAPTLARAAPARGRRPCSGLVVALDVRNQCEIARPLDCRGELPLVPRTHAAQPTGKDLSVIGNEAAQRAVIFVVHVANARFAEWAGLLRSAHHSSSSS